jgi:hypothetical protein
MREVVTMVGGIIDDLAHLLLSFVAIGAIGEILFGSGFFGVNVIYKFIIAFFRLVNTFFRL